MPSRASRQSMTACKHCGRQRSTLRATTASVPRSARVSICISMTRADGIDRHVAEQRRVYQRQVVSQRQALIQRAAELEHDNDDKIMGLAEANATAAGEGARMDGIAADSPEEAAAILGCALGHPAQGHRRAHRQPQRPPGAGPVRPGQGPARAGRPPGARHPVQATRLDQAADQWITRETGTDGPPLQERLDADPDLPSAAKPIVRAKLDARESADESTRVAKVQALDDELHRGLHAPDLQSECLQAGHVRRLANAYEARRRAERAEFARRMSGQDTFIATFTQLSSEKQRQTIDDWPRATFATVRSPSRRAKRRHSITTPSAPARRSTKKLARPYPLMMSRVASGRLDRSRSCAAALLSCLSPSVRSTICVGLSPTDQSKTSKPFVTGSR